MPSRASFRMRGRGTMLANHAFTWLETLIEMNKHWLHGLVEKPTVSLSNVGSHFWVRVRGYLLANHSRDSDGEDIDRCFTLGVWIWWYFWFWYHVVLYLSLQRGDATYLSANLLVDDRGNLVGLRSVMMGVYCLYLCLAVLLMERKFFCHSMLVVNLCILGYLNILF